MKSFQSICQEATEYGIAITDGDGVLSPIVFRLEGAGNAPLAWMYQIGGSWVGYTAQPGVTGKKHGRKGIVANWCLGWAVNGF